MKSIIYILMLHVLLLTPTLEGSQLLAQSFYPGQQVDKIKENNQTPIKAYAFDLKDIRLLDSPFKQNQERNGKLLLSLKNDELLLNFRITAGINTHIHNMASPLGGWEAPHVELRGHSIGHVLSALALMYASTGEEEYKLKSEALITELATVQKELNQDGYLSAFPQKLIDRAIQGSQVWAPWYTLHKILAGLIDQYLYTDNPLALQVAEKMGTWVYYKVIDLNQEELDRMLIAEAGGIAEPLYNLYALTGNKNYLDAARQFYFRKWLDPLAEEKDILQGHHANTYIPTVLAEVRDYELTNTVKKGNIGRFFWQCVIDHHTYATGGNSDYEHFFAPDSLSKHMSPRTTESCNTYNMLKLAEHLFTWSSDVKYADYYEQALYNHILATQDPETGMMCYFMPFKPGMFKVYSTPKHSFWCCMGTGFENHSKYGEAIYFHDDKGLIVNLFIPSTLDWKEKGIKIHQETSYPETDKITLRVEASKGEKYSIRIRYPSWAKNGAEVKINGRKQRINTTPGSYIELKRLWNSGDVIEICYPMQLRLVPANDNPNLAAIAYGPIVLAGEMGRLGLSDPAPYAKDQLDYVQCDVPEGLINTIETEGESLSKWVKALPHEAPLTFELRRCPHAESLKLIPYYRLHHQRYVLYWNFKMK